MGRGGTLRPRTGDRRGLKGVMDQLRSELLARAEARQLELEAAEETGKPVNFRGRQSFIDHGGTIAEIVSSLLPDDVDLIPDEYLPYLTDPSFHSARPRAAEVKEIFEGRQGPELQAPPPSLQKTVGGRPPQAFWDDLLIDTIRQIYDGDWKPRSTEEIVRRMQDWLIDKGENAGETALKERARKIKAAFVDR